MNEKKLIAKNAVVGLTAQILSLLLSFVSRTFFLRYIGVEILGLSGTLTSVISALSLVDLGFYSAVIFRLYDPLINQRYEECCEIITVLRRFLYTVAIVIAGLFACATPLLRYILNGIEVTSFVYKAYALFCVNSVISYFLAYKRTLLYADGKDSIAKAVDSFCNLCFTGIKVLVIVFTKNFLIYQAIAIFQTVVSNLIIHLYCRKKYLWLHKTTINKSILKLLFTDTKNIFASKIAGYVYGATDNLVISLFLKTVTVGFYSNYLMLQSSLRMLSDSITAQISPFIGREYAKTKEKIIHRNIIVNYTFIRYLMAGFFIVPFYCLANSFIIWWLGANYTLDSLLIFLCIDLYIHIVHSVFGDYEGAAGLFKQEKKISVIGACTNICSSILLVNLVGLSGVIMGTAVSQVVYWILRGKLILKELFNFEKRFLLKYILQNLFYCLIIIATIFIISLFINYINLEYFILTFIFQCIICELVFFSLSGVCFGWTKPFRYCVNTVLKRNSNVRL